LKFYYNLSGGESKQAKEDISHSLFGNYRDVLILFAFNRQYEYNYTFILPEMFTMANVNNTDCLANPLKVRAEACF
jgi:hypothetical protein